MLLMNLEAKTKKILAIESTSAKKELYSMTKLELFQGCKAGSTFEIKWYNPSCQQTKVKSHKMLSIDAGNAFDKIQHTHTHTHKYIGNMP